MNSYSYDKEGNICNKKENHQYTRYTYDNLNRLIREDNEELNQTILYSFDSNGNIQNKEIYSYTLTDNLENKQCIEYNYTEFNDYLSKYNGKEIKYDSLGNPVLYKDIPLVWKERELRKYNNIEYAYNVNHIRTKKKLENQSIEYILDGTRILKEKRTDYITQLENIIDEGSYVEAHDEEIEYIYSNQGIIGFDHIKDGQSKRYYYNKNILGDILEIYDDNGKIVGKYSYDAYGNHKILINVDNIAHINPFRYRSYYYDEETGLYLVTSRYYNPEWCRFLNADSVEYLDPTNINGLNLFAYCYNNPINYVDPDGHFPILTLILCGLALAGMGLTISGVASDNNVMTAVGLSLVAVPALISGIGAIVSGAAGATALGIIGGVTAVAGLGTVTFATAEYQEAFTGNNWMLDAGMSEGWYNGLMITTAAIATAGTITNGVLTSIGRAATPNQMMNSFNKHPNRWKTVKELIEPGRGGNKGGISTYSNYINKWTGSKLGIHKIIRGGRFIHGPHFHPWF